MINKSSKLQQESALLAEDLVAARRVGWERVAV